MLQCVLDFGVHTRRIEMKGIDKKILSVAMSLFLIASNTLSLKAHQTTMSNYANSLTSIEKSKVINKIVGFSLPSIALIASIAGLTYHFTKSPATPSPKPADVPTDKPIISDKTSCCFDLEKYRVEKVGERKLPNGTLFKPERHVVLDSEQFRDYLSTTKQLVYFRGVAKQQNENQYTNDFVLYGLGISTTPEAKGNKAGADHQRPSDPVYFAHYLETPLEFAGRFKHDTKNTYSMIYVAVVLDDNSDVEEYGLKYMDENKNFVLCSDPFIIYPGEWEGKEYQTRSNSCAATFYSWLRKALKNNPNNTNCDGVLYRFKKWIFSKGLVFETSAKGNTYCVYNRSQADKLLSQMK